MADDDGGWKQYWKIAGTASELAGFAKSIGGLLSSVVPAAGAYVALASDHPVAFVVLVAITAVLLSSSAAWFVAGIVNQGRDRRIATAFQRLEDFYLRFEVEVIKLVYFMTLTSGNTLVLDLNDLRRAHSAYLEEICNTACRAIGAKKGGRRRVAANIKQIEVVTLPNDRVDFKYLIMVRSSSTTKERMLYDQRLEKTPHYISNNYVYKRIFDEDITDDYFIHNDMDKLLKQIDREARTPQEPNPQTSRFYKSFISHPIYGGEGTFRQISKSLPHLVAASAKKPGGLMSYNNREVFGIMCIDSKNKNVFNSDYDLTVMRQLTAYAFSTFRVVRAIEQLAEMKQASGDYPSA